MVYKKKCVTLGRITENHFFFFYTKQSIIKHALSFYNLTDGLKQSKRTIQDEDYGSTIHIFYSYSMYACF